MGTGLAKCSTDAEEILPERHLGSPFADRQLNCGGKQRICDPTTMFHMDWEPSVHDACTCLLLAPRPALAFATEPA